MIITRIEYLQREISHLKMSRFRKKIESLSEQSKGGIIRTSKISGSCRKWIGEKLGG